MTSLTLFEKKTDKFPAADSIPTSIFEQAIDVMAPFFCGALQ
jgi:hypothetical protein